MNRTSLLGALGAALLLTGVATTASATPVATGRVDTQVVNITGYRPGTTELAALRGPYLLANGEQLTLVAQGHRLLAEWGSGDALPLQAVSDTVYRSADGALQVAFQAAENGSVSGVVVTTRR